MDLALQLVSSAERTGDVPGKCSYGSRGEARVFFHVLLRQQPISHRGGGQWHWQRRFGARVPTELGPNWPDDCDPGHMPQSASSLAN